MVKEKVFALFNAAVRISNNLSTLNFHIFYVSELNEPTWTNDIKRQAKCAKKVHSVLGFEAFDVWVENCKEKTIESIDECFPF